MDKQVDADFQAAGITLDHTLSKRWGQIIALYLSLCAVFIGIILYQSIQGMEDRVIDCLLVLVGAVFFMIQATMKRNAAKRQERATAHTFGTLVKTGSRKEIGSNKRNFYSVYEFSVNDVIQQVEVAGINKVEKGEQVDLYYVPHYPKMVYIPRVEASRRWMGVGYYAIGIGFPLISLIIPLFEI